MGNKALKAVPVSQDQQALETLQSVREAGGVYRPKVYETRGPHPLNDSQYVESQSMLSTSWYLTEGRQCCLHGIEATGGHSQAIRIVIKSSIAANASIYALFNRSLYNFPVLCCYTSRALRFAYHAVGC